MFTKLKKSKGETERGFTIIEVMIVLAIAGLILLIVFLAVPALQRSSRNTQRKDDVSKVGSAISNFENNNNGAIPATAGDFNTDVNYGYYTVANVTYAAAAPAAVPAANVDKVYVYGKATCAGNTVSTTAGGARQVAIQYWVETTAGNTSQCLQT